MLIQHLAPWKDGPVIAYRERFTDSRGSFEMIFEFGKLRESIPFFPQILQVNLLHGRYGSLRGFHWARLKENHWKVLTVIRGSVRDAFMDVREGSPTFGVVGFLDLSSRSKCSLVIPPGFAHGMQTTNRESTSVYATNVPYSQNRELAFSPVSEGLESLWTAPVTLSDRDSKAEAFTKRISIIELPRLICKAKI